MKVVCISTQQDLEGVSNGIIYLTIGKIYNAEVKSPYFLSLNDKEDKTTYSSYWVMDDHGMLRIYSSKLFNTLREENLNKIID